LNNFESFASDEKAPRLPVKANGGAISEV